MIKKIDNGSYVNEKRKIKMKSQVKESNGFDQEYQRDLLKKVSDMFYFVESDDDALKIIIQNGSIREFGKNGAEITILLKLYLAITEDFNKRFNCPENDLAINSVRQALAFDKLRIKDRIKREVEGLNKN